MSPQPYRRRLAVEGATLAVAGLGASAALLITQEQARRWPQQTAAQLVLVTLGLLGPGTRAVRRSLRDARRVGRRRAGDGDPTPLVHVPVPMVAGALAVGPVGVRAAPVLRLPRRLGRRAGWDAALRVTGGAALVGLWQALVLAPLVAREERRRGRTAVRLRGSRLGSTRLGWVRSTRP